MTIEIKKAFTPKKVHRILKEYFKLKNFKIDYYNFGNGVIKKPIINRTLLDKLIFRTHKICGYCERVNLGDDTIKIISYENEFTKLISKLKIEPMNIIIVEIIEDIYE